MLFLEMRGERRAAYNEGHGEMEESLYCEREKGNTGGKEREWRRRETLYGRGGGRD